MSEEKAKVKKFVIDLDKPMLTLDSEPYKDEETMGRIVADRMSSDPELEGIKYLDWSLSLWRGESLSLDESDYNKIKNYIEKKSKLPVLFRGQILKEIASD